MGQVIPFTQQAPADPLSPYEDELLEAADELALFAVTRAAQILGDGFDIDIEARCLLRTALELLIFELEGPGAA